MQNRPLSASIGYKLALSDGTQWYLTADTPLLPWLDKFAAIMRLNKGSINGEQKIIYSLPASSTLSTSSRSKIQNRQTSDRWERTDLQRLCLCSHKDAPEMTCEIMPLRYAVLQDDGLTQADRIRLELIGMWNALFPIYQQNIRRGGLPFHAALIEKKGAGVLLAACGDTGKSTCCRRLPANWTPLCDDEALVAVDKKKHFRAHPFPTWSDYMYRGSDNTWDIQYSVPLCGVFFLEQADTDEAVALGEGEAAALVNSSVTQVCEKYWRTASREFQRNCRRQAFDNAYALARNIPAFKLRVSLNGRFWEIIEQALGW